MWGPFAGAGDLAERGAILLRGIAQDHPFVDGNKRTAFEALDLFLRLNGAFIEAESDDIVEFMLQVAQGEHAVESIARWIRVHARNL